MEFENIKLIATGNRDCPHLLTKGKVYETIYGVEHLGISPEPYVTVMADNGKKLACHKSRFKEINENS